MPFLIISLSLPHLFWGAVQASKEGAEVKELRVGLTRHQPTGQWSLLRLAPQLGRPYLVFPQIAAFPEWTGGPGDLKGQVWAWWYDHC